MSMSLWMSNTFQIIKGTEENKGKIYIDGLKKILRAHLINNNDIVTIIFCILITECSMEICMSEFICLKTSSQTPFQMVLPERYQVHEFLRRSLHRTLS